MRDYELNKFHEKIINIIKDLLKVDDKINFLIEEASQKALDDLCDSIDSADKKWESLKVSLLPLIKLIAGEEQEEIKAEKTDNGFKL